MIALIGGAAAFNNKDDVMAPLLLYGIPVSS